MENNAGSVLLLLTISATSALNEATVIDLKEYNENRDQIVQKYVIQCNKKF